MAPSFGFEIPILVLVLGIVILAVGLFVGGLNAVTYAGIAIGFAAIVGLVLAAAATPAPDHESGERAER